jgi:light-regulated signal transduction histidine kinase (bacteriophytochrome)
VKVRNSAVHTAIRRPTDRIPKSIGELEQRVSELTRELTRSNEALHQFAWAASHDFQEPIRTVLSYSQWLGELSSGKLGDQETQILNLMERQAQRMQQLLSGLQRYIRVSESEQEWTMVDCNTVASETISDLDDVIEEAGATVVWLPLPRIASIESLLGQIFQNLIGNGLRHRSERAPVIEISARRDTTGWVFSVRDNGIGIDAKYFDYIFGVFRRLDETKQSGTGTGLAICRAAVERRGGRIWVESSLDSGSVFRFFLPRRPADGRHVESSSRLADLPS